MRQEDYKERVNRILGGKQPIASAAPTPPIIKYRFYDFISRTWAGYTHEAAHEMSYDQAMRHVPQFASDLNRLAYLVYEQKPETSPFEALLVILLNSQGG